MGDHCNQHKSSNCGDECKKLKVKKLQVKKSAVICGDLTVGGKSNLDTLIVTNSTTISGSLNVTSTTSFKDVTIAGTSNLNGLLNVAGTSNLNGSLNVAGTSNLNGPLNVAGTSNLNGPLNVAGTSNLKNINVVGTSNVTGTSNVAGVLNVNGDAYIKNLKVDTFEPKSIVSDTADIKNLQSNFILSDSAIIQNLDVGVIEAKAVGTYSANIDHAEIGSLKTFDAERFVNPDYDRFKQGVLPKLTQVFGSNTYEYENLSHLALPESGNAWSTVVRGFINFSTATDSEKLNFYSGATNRLYRLVIDRPWSATEKEIKVGFINGISNNSNGNTFLEPAIPTDQQKFAADALDKILVGFQSINFNNLSPSDLVVYYNHITICKIFIEAFNIGDFDTSNMGNDYVYVPNKNCRSNYCWLFSNCAPVVNFSYIVGTGVNTDPGYLLTWARAAPIILKYVGTVMDQHIKAGIDGISKGFYPHILRVNPYNSKDMSTFGDAAYNYEKYIVDEVNATTFQIQDNSTDNVALDYKYVSPTIQDFDENANDDTINGNNSVGGYNPKLLIDLVVSSGLMSSEEGKVIMDLSRQQYYENTMPAINRFLYAYYYDPKSVMVKALKLTRWDDYPGEWGTKFEIDSRGFVKGTAITGPIQKQVYVDVLTTDNVVIYDDNGVNNSILLKDVVLQRDVDYGKKQYKANIQLILGLQEDSPIPVFQLSDPNQKYDPINNPYKVTFLDNTSGYIVDRIHKSGVEMLKYFDDLIDYNLDVWSVEKNGKPWAQVYPTQQKAIDALSFDDRYISDLEDPAKGGNYSFIQHYSPKIDPVTKNPVYDYSILQSYYVNSDPKGIPLLKLTQSGRVDGPILKDNNGNILYDPTSATVGGFVNIEALYKASSVDKELKKYWKNMGSIDIANGKSAKLYYFNFDFSQKAYQSYITGGVNPTPNPIMSKFFSPYIVSQFAKRQAMKYLQSYTASGSSFDAATGIITYTNFLNISDPHNSHSATQGGERSTFVHEWLMGHSIQIPLQSIITTLGKLSWTASAFGNGAVAEGWAVFLETYFCGAYTTYLSETDHYYNYLSNSGKADPKAVVSQLLNASRVAARLKWDTAVHGIIHDENNNVIKTSMAEYFKGFKKDTHNTFDANTEIAQRIPVCPGQGLNYGLAFCQLIGLFQSLSNSPTDPISPGIGKTKFDSLQANGNKAFKYFFDFVLIDTIGAFLGSIEPAYSELIYKINNNIAPFNDSNYDGYPTNAFAVHTNAYVQGSNPACYEFKNNPYVSGGFTFKFPDQAVPQ